jgi:hypothetical protein
MLKEKTVRKIWKASLEDEKVLNDIIKNPKKLKKQFKLSDEDVVELEELISKKVSIKDILNKISKGKDLELKGGIWPPITPPWLKTFKAIKVKKPKKGK